MAGGNDYNCQASRDKQTSTVDNKVHVSRHTYENNNNIIIIVQFIFWKTKPGVKWSLDVSFNTFRLVLDIS